MRAPSRCFMCSVVASLHWYSQRDLATEPTGATVAIPRTGTSRTVAADMLVKLQTAVCYLPHPDKVGNSLLMHQVRDCSFSPLLNAHASMQVSYGGEDAHFVSEVGGGAIGVADGVGGWQESGVNPAGAGLLRGRGQQSGSALRI